MFDPTKVSKTSLEYQILSKVSIADYFNRQIVADMPWYFDDKQIDFDYKPVVKCPLHGEDTPSFRNYFNDTDSLKYYSFYCFGCGKGGTVINLHMYYVESKTGRKISYNEAIKDLSQLFSDVLHSTVSYDGTSRRKILSEREAKGYAKRIEQDKAKEFAFNQVYSRIEKQIQIDDIPLKKRKVLYRALDDAVRFVKDGIIEAETALEYIETVCNQNGVFI